MIVPALVVAALLRTTDPALDAARSELSAVALRIEQLKSRYLAGEDVGRELNRLLVRAQELATEIERREWSEGAPVPVLPTPDELHERADALRDEADRLEATLAEVDVRLAAARRSAGPGPGLSRAAIGGRTTPQEDAHVQALLVERARIVARLAAVRSGAAELEAQAREAERE